MIFIESRRRKIKNIKKIYPQSAIIDVTSKGIYPFLKFSPFYPIGDIPIPFTANRYSASVEGIWQGLKVFEEVDVDEKKFAITNMKGLKRTIRKYGKPKGHRKGIEGNELLGYIDARKQIYLPTYKWVLQNKLSNELTQLQKIMTEEDLVLLDYETNGDIENALKPLSHAHLIKLYVENKL